MDTKSKGFNLFNILKYFLVVIMLASVLVIIPSLSYVNNIVYSEFENFYDTYQFEEEYNRLIHNVVEYNLILKSKEHIEASSKESVYLGDETFTYNNPNDENIIESTVESKLQRLNTIEERLANTVNFIYYIQNSNTGEVYTNSKDENPVDYIKKQINYVYYNQYKAVNSSEFNYNDDILRMLNSTDYEVHTAVHRSLRIGDEFFVQYTHFNQLMKIYPMIRGILIVSGIIFLITLGFLMKFIGRNSKGEVTNFSLDRIYNEIQLIVAFIFIWITEFLIDPVLNIFLRGYNTNIYYNMDLAKYISIALIVDVLLLLGLSFLRQFKNKRLLKNTITYELAKMCFKTKYFKPGIILVFIAYVLVNAILGVILIGSLNQGGFAILIAFSVFMGFNIFAFGFLLRSLKSLDIIMKIAKQVSQGNFQDVLDKNQISLSFRDFYIDIISIKDGMKNAVQEAIKGERLKTELITNVSHDLKTPLTSIINYVDLLKREDLRGDKSKEYVTILEEKSLRLKQLVDDLLEASKASSGNLTVDYQELDLNELIQQAVGECDEKFVDANLEVRLHTLVQGIPIFGDSKHMWRIAENLLTNTLKYAMPYTRVYIDTEIKDGYGMITIKNVSAQPLDISPEELTKRFVRGDESRTTEGSGLGLSIAESLTNIQGGKFTIEIDGDLFKVTVSIPLLSKE